MISYTCGIAITPFDWLLSCTCRLYRGSSNSHENGHCCGDRLLDMVGPNEVGLLYGEGLSCLPLLFGEITSTGPHSPSLATRFHLCCARRTGEVGDFRPQCDDRSLISGWDLRCSYTSAPQWTPESGPRGRGVFGLLCGVLSVSAARSQWEIGVPAKTLRCSS